MIDARRPHLAPSGPAGPSQGPNSKFTTQNSKLFGSTHLLFHSSAHLRVASATPVLGLSRLLFALSVDLPPDSPRTAVRLEKESHLGNIGLSAVVSSLLFQLTAAEP